MPLLTVNSIKNKLSKVNEFIHTLDEKTELNFYDSGCYVLNLLLSGSLFGGFSDKITVFSGFPSSGKTFLMLSGAKNFLDISPDNIVIIFDSEGGISSSMLSSVGIDISRVVIIPVLTVQEFRTQCLTIIEEYIQGLKQEGKEVPEKSNVMFALDSIGMLSTTKELTDSTDGKEALDMTRAKLLRSTFRTITLKLSIYHIPLLAVSHSYQSMSGLFPTTEMGGGRGAEYSASSVIFLNKSKDKEGNEIVGNIVTATAKKSRLSKENSKVQLKISYTGGLSRYYGLVDLALEAGLYKKASSYIVLPDGSKQYEKTIYKNPEKYFTQEFLEELDRLVKPLYNYISDIEENVNED